MGGDQGYSQGPDDVSPLGDTTDHRDDGKTWGRRRVGVFSGRGGDGICRFPPHQSIHQEATYNHSGEGVLSSYICIVHGVRADDGDKTYGSKIWVATRDILKVLTTFHRWATRRITGMTAKHGAGVEWEYSAVEEAMESAGFRPIRVYIKRRHTTIAERVYCRPIYALCTESERMTGTKRMVLWWDQDAINYPEEYTRKRCN